jgi:outer membrane protein assembly factor BamA
MKKYLFYAAALLIVLNIFSSSLQAQDTDENNGGSEEEVVGGISKAVFFDLGFGGPAGLSGGLGFRYSYFSFTLGLSGFANKVPAYQINNYGTGINASQPLPVGYSQESYSALIVTGDFGFNYEIVPKITAFASIGYYSQQDTILAHDYKQDLRYYYKYYTSSGLCYSIGGEYAITDDINVGIGYHTKRGVFGRIAYTWK